MMADMFISPFGTAVLAIGTPAEVFSFADDNLCEWVTEEEIAGFIAEAFDWNGTAILTPDDWTCVWRLIGDEDDEVGFVFARDATGEFKVLGEPLDFAALDVVDFSDNWWHDDVEAAMSGHPDLSVGVLVHTHGWGQYVFWVPPGHEYLLLYVPRISGALEFDGDDGDFVVADQIVRELGWVD